LEAEVEVFPQEGGWAFIRVPKSYSDVTKELADRGLVAITAAVGRTSWDTSLLPMGDGTHFIALNKRVRQAENIRIGDRIQASFRLRER